MWMAKRLWRRGVGKHGGKATTRGGAGHAALAVEMLEQRQLLTATTTTTAPTHYLAPATLSGGTLTATIAAGTAPLQTAGAYTLQPGATGTLTATPAGGSPVSETYNFSRTGLNTAVLRYIDPATGAVYFDNLTFATATSGTFAITPAVAGTAGAQSGTFSYAPVAVPLGADEIVTFIHTPAATTATAGEHALVIVNVANVGSTGGIGFITVTFYLSPDGLASDGTPVGSTGKLIALGLQQSYFAGVVITYPHIASGSYYLVAAFTPSAVFSDTDRSNDVAVSPGAVALTSPTIAPPLPTIALDTTIAGIAPATLNGGKLAEVELSVVNDGSARFEGYAAVNILASTVSSGANFSVLMAGEKSMVLAPGQSARFPVVFVVPTSIASGNYYVLAQSGPAIAQITTDTGVQSITVPTGSMAVTASTTPLAQPAVPTLTASVGSLTGPSGATSTFVPDQLDTASVTLTNIGAGVARGFVTVELFAAPVGNPDAIAHIYLTLIAYRPLILEPGDSATFQLQFRVPAKLAILAPSYNLFTLVDATNVLGITNPTVTAQSSQLLSA